MAYIAPNEETVVIVGGLGDQSGAAGDNGGGATKAAWDAFTPSAFMGANGGPFTADTACNFTTADKQITKASSNIGLNVKVGTLVYVSTGAGGHIDAGCYEITAVPDNDTITVANIVDDGNDATGVTVNVGGALNTLQNALDNPVNSATTPVPGHNRYIYDNIATETITATIDVDTNGGQTTTRIFVIGYNSDLTAEAEIEITTTSTLANGLMKITTFDYYTFRKIDFDGGNKTDNAAYCFYGATTGGGEFTVFENCKFHGASSHGLYMRSSYKTLVNCEIYGNGGDGYHTVASSSYSKFIGCSIHDNDSEGIYTRDFHALFLNCSIYDNGSDGIKTFSSPTNLIITGCTIYGNTGDGVDIAAGTVYVSLLNNTSVGNGGYGFNFNSEGIKQLAFFGYNHSHNNTSGHYSEGADNTFADFRDGNNQVGDPLFTSVVDGSEDFVPLSGSPLINNALQFGGTGNLDIGTEQEASGGGGGILIPTGMTGGIRG